MDTVSPRRKAPLTPTSPANLQSYHSFFPFRPRSRRRPRPRFSCFPLCSPPLLHPRLSHLFRLPDNLPITPQHSSYTKSLPILLFTQSNTHLPPLQNLFIIFKSPPIKVLLPIFGLLFVLTSLSALSTEKNAAGKTDACALLQQPEFLGAFARSIGLHEREIEKAFIDTNSGKSNSELVLILKPISKVPASKVAQGLQTTIQKNVLSPQFAGTAGSIIDEKAGVIYSIGVHGNDQGKRIRIAADVITLSDGTVRLKLMCVTSPE